jgi:MFS family permease
MAVAHRTGPYATVAMTAGAIITGLTVLSSFSAARVYLSEQFPTALRGRGHFFGEATARLFAGVVVPFLLEPYTHSATIFFGAIAVVVAVGACVPLLLGRETVGQLETVTETAEERAEARAAAWVGYSKRRGFAPRAHHLCLPIAASPLGL